MDVVRLPGLKIADDLDMYYKNDKIYDQEMKLGSSAEILKCAGEICKCFCFPCAPCGCGPLMQIKQGEMGLLLQQGKLIAKLGPGLHTYNNCLDELIRVDMKTQIIELPK